jgi:hypothetical protein
MSPRASRFGPLSFVASVPDADCAALAGAAGINVVQVAVTNATTTRPSHRRICVPRPSMSPPGDPTIEAVQ